ncbi:MAG: hypothetical protein H0T14_00920 [Nocardioidaceae bacterium]|nr:hypothetical protein [Nocardioidaceae bacterium]
MLRDLPSEAFVTYTGLNLPRPEGHEVRAQSSGAAGEDRRVADLALLDGP